MGAFSCCLCEPASVTAGPLFTHLAAQSDPAILGAIIRFGLLCYAAASAVGSPVAMVVSIVVVSVAVSMFCGGCVDGVGVLGMVEAVMMVMVGGGFGGGSRAYRGAIVAQFSPTVARAFTGVSPPVYTNRSRLRWANAQMNRSPHKAV